MNLDVVKVADVVQTHCKNNNPQKNIVNRLLKAYFFCLIFLIVNLNQAICLKKIRQVTVSPSV